MGWLVGGLVESLVALLCKLIVAIMNGVTGIFSTALGADQTAFKTVFPVMGSIQNAFMVVGFCLAIAFMMLGCLRNMVSGLGFAGENPFKMACRFIMAAILVPLLPMGMNYFYTYTEGSSGLFQSIYQTIDNEVKVTNGSPYGTGNFFEIAGNATNVISGGMSKVAASIIVLILMSVIAINFIKLLLEMFERYLLINVLIYFSPLAAPAVTLESTMKIFSSYLKMYFGQMVMLLMNLVSLKIITSGMNMAGDIIGGASTVNIPGIQSEFLPFVVLLLIIAMLKVLQRVDNYARDIGLTVGVTGGSLVDEIMGMRGMFSPIIGAFTGGKGGGKGFAAGAAAGAATGGLMGSLYRHSPLGAVLEGAKDTVKGYQAAKANTGISNPHFIDVCKHYSENGGFKAFTADVSKGAAESRAARAGAGGIGTGAVTSAVMGKVAPDAKAQADAKAVNDIGVMMNSSAPIRNIAATSRGTQVAFRNFADGLSPADVHSPASVPISGLSHVSVGNGGALGTNANGDLIALTTYQPTNSDSAFTTEYISPDGTQYWAQNLSQANDISMSENNGREYSVYRKAQKTMEMGSTNYDFEGKAFRGAEDSIYEGSVPSGVEVPTPTSSPDPQYAPDASDFQFVSAEGATQTYGTDGEYTSQPSVTKQSDFSEPAVTVENDSVSVPLDTSYVSFQKKEEVIRHESDEEFYYHREQKENSNNNDNDYDSDSTDGFGKFRKKRK